MLIVAISRFIKQIVVTYFYEYMRSVWLKFKKKKTSLRAS